MTARPKYVGQAVARLEDRRLLLGRGQYVADIQLPGMLHMTLLRSPHAHARIRAIRTDEALALTGIAAVVTYSSLPRPVNPLPCIDLFPDSKAALHTVLADQKVRYVGEPVAAVVASDRYVAEDALERIQVDYEPLPAVVDAEAAVEPDAPILYEEFETNLANTIRQNVGDVDKAFREADRTFKETFRIHRYAAVPMETRGVVAEWASADDRLTLWSSTQFPHLARGFLAAVLGMPQSRIRVVAPDVGGGFGTKCEFYSEEVIAPLLAQQLGRPVKWIEDRIEHFQSTTHAREQIHHVEAAVQRDGTVTALTSRSYTNNGAAMFTLATTPASIYSAMLRGPYRIPNYRVESHSVLTNKVPLAVYRGAGHPQAVFCMERMMDIIARELGRDPAELRKQNMLTKEELPSDRGTEIVLAGKVEYDTGDYPGCLDRALELMDYPAFRREQEAARGQGRYLGVGISCFVEETAIGPYETATVRVDGAGKITVLTGNSPHGQGHVTTISQLVADEFEVDIADVLVLHGDTDVVPDGIGTFASRSGAIGGAAARCAAREVRQKAMKLAAHHLETGEADLEWADGAVQVKGAPARRMSLGELAQKATAWNVLPEGMDFDLQAVYHHQVPGISFANAVHIAIVAIDSETGQVAIRDYGVVHDCGTVINPTIVEGQVHGGVAQGVGGTLLEELVYDAEGQLLTTTFMDYLLPTAADVPFMKSDHMESPTYLNPYGMKGAGEGGATGSPAAVVNAIADALSPLGVRLNDDGPYSPAKVYELLKRR